MRHVKNIFEDSSPGKSRSFHSRGPFGLRLFSGGCRLSFLQLFTITLSVLSAAGALAILVNFAAITAAIASALVKLLSSGLFLLVIFLLALFLIGRARWRLHRAFWGW